MLNVAVTNCKGGFVSGLPRMRSTCVEKDNHRRSTFFAEQDAPATIGLLIDASGSMLENRDRVIAGVTEFAKASHPDDEFLPLVFNEQCDDGAAERDDSRAIPPSLRDALTTASRRARGGPHFTMRSPKPSRCRARPSSSARCSSS